MISRKQMARYIDHTLLKPHATSDEIEHLCHEAKTHGFYSVCVNPHYVSLAAKTLLDTPVKVVATVGFPLGASLRRVKIFEAQEAMGSGADEVDMVMNVGLLKEGDFFALKEDIEGVVKGVKGIISGGIVKVILETCYLEEDEIVSACRIASDAGADYVKTSTGFGPEGAKVEHVRIMKSMSQDKMLVKAAGGIKDLKTAMAMIDAGASRIGTSSGIAIVESVEE